MRNKIILSVDGGGAMGIGPCAYMEALHAKYKDIKFDAYAGSSVGALIVALAATGLSWTDVRKVFEKEIPKAFTKPSLAWMLNPWRPRYDGKAFQRICKEYLGDATIKDLNKPVFITSFDFLLGKPKVFDYMDDMPLWKAIMCSTAAPTYFPPVDDRFVDGGLVANNPSMVAITAAIGKLGWDLKNIHCLSLGTNGIHWPIPNVRKISKLGWIKPLISTFLVGNEEQATYQAKELLRWRYMRVEPRINKDIELDDFKTAIAECKPLWQTLAKANSNSIIAWYKEVINEN